MGREARESEDGVSRNVGTPRCGVTARAERAERGFPG